MDDEPRDDGRVDGGRVDGGRVEGGRARRQAGRAGRAAGAGRRGEGRRAAGGVRAGARRGRSLRRTRRAALAGALVGAALAVGALLHDPGTSRAVATPPAASPAPSGSPPSSPYSTAFGPPAIRPEQAFPGRAVLLADGSRYRRLELVTTTDCAAHAPSDAARELWRAHGCERVTSALFTDAEERVRITVSVLTFRWAQDADAVAERLLADPGAHRPAPPLGLAGPTVRHATAVRSVIVAQGRRIGGSGVQEGGGEAESVRRTEDLLRDTRARVLAYENPAEERD